MALDLRTYAYRQLQTPAFDSIDRLARAPLGERLRAALDLKDPVGEFVRRFLPPALAYAAELGPQISHSVQDFDRVMRWGFGWEAGPFEQIDLIGAERLGLAEGPWYRSGEMRAFDGSWMAQRSEPEFRALADYPIIEDRGPLRIRDLGEGVHSVSLLTKMGAVSPEAVLAMHRLLDENSLDRFVLAGEGAAFSVGFDLRFFVQALADKADGAIAEAIESLQSLCLRLSQTRSVAAVHGWCLGGGFEVALGCSRIVADAEAKIGLPESRVGLVPGGGGTMQMRIRAGADAQKLASLVAALAAGRISENADDAARIGYLARTDVVVDHPDGLITRAREEALRIEPEARPWTVAAGPLAGMVDAALEKASAIDPLTGYDRAIAERLKNVMTKADSLEDGLERERTAFFELIHEGQTLARMNHMLETGKPLRN
jgi:3-hydroxyacyl-CoA dehydrogenase